MEHTPNIARAIAEALAWMNNQEDQVINNLVADPADLPNDALIVLLDDRVLAWI